MVKTTPFHERLAAAQPLGAVGPLVRTPVRPEVRHVLEARVLRHPQRRRGLRLLALVQVLDQGPGRRAVPCGRRDEGHPEVPSRARRYYTVWCDDRGYVLEDGVFFRHSESEFFLTAARPNLGYFSDLASRYDVGDRGRLATSTACSPSRARGRERYWRRSRPRSSDLAYFDHTAAKIGSSAVRISRTGYTGDLGFEIFVPGRGGAGGLRRRAWTPVVDTASGPSARRR